MTSGIKGTFWTGLRREKKKGQNKGLNRIVVNGELNDAIEDNIMLTLFLFTLIHSAAQITDVTISPDPMLVGEQAQIECRVSEPDEVAKASLVIFNGLMEMDMTHQGELVQDLPIDAPTGTFPASIVAELKDGTRVEHKFSFTITEAGVLSSESCRETGKTDEYGLSRWL